MGENVVRLLEHGNGDIAHARAMWASTGKTLTPENIARIPERLQFLATSGHTSPFEHSQLSFAMTAEYASHIHIIKHRIGVSVNTESARYKEYTEDKWYNPPDWSAEEQGDLNAHCGYSFYKYHETIRRL